MSQISHPGIFYFPADVSRRPTSARAKIRRRRRQAAGRPMWDIEMRRRWRPTAHIKAAYPGIYRSGLLRGPDPQQAQEEGSMRTREGERRKLKSALSPYRYASIYPPLRLRDIGHLGTHTPARACQRSPSATCRGDSAYRRQADSAGPHLNPSGVGRPNCTAPFRNCTAASGGLSPLIPIHAGRGRHTQKGIRS